MDKIWIVGGGASGMVAAIQAKTKDNEVIVLEKNDRVGKKILATGNGKCNLGNENLSVDCYYSRNRSFVEQVLKRYDTESTISFFASLGLKVRSRNGYLYPYAEQASAVLDVLRMELERRKIRVETGVQITECVPLKKQRYLLKASDGRSYEADRVILSCGGPASLKEGGMDGYIILQKLGLKTYPLVPGLVQLKTDDKERKAMSGVRCQASLRLFVDGILQGSEQGELQLTDYGISGIPVFQLSRMAAYAVKECKSVTIQIDFVPEYSYDEIVNYLLEQQKVRKEQSVDELLTGFLNKKLNLVLLKKCQIAGSRKSGSLQKKEIRQLAGLYKNYEVHITDTNPFLNAQVCAGGLDIEEVDGQMQVKKYPGLFVTGELLDVDGICGGYNLHWAFATGTIAGKSIRG